MECDIRFIFDLFVVEKRRESPVERPYVMQQVNFLLSCINRELF